MASRYLRPSRRHRFLSFITAIATLGVMFGTCALLVSLSILEGYGTTLRSTIIDFMGHIELTTDFGVFSGTDSIAASDEVEREIERTFDEVERLAPFIRKEAIIRSDNGLEGVLLKGVDPERDISVVGSRVIEGEYVRRRDRQGEIPGVVLGARLAERLQLEVGDTAVLFIAEGRPDMEGTPTIEQVEIDGIYRSGMAQYDDIYVFTELSTAQSLLGYRSDVVTGFDILLKDEESSRFVAAAMNDHLHTPFVAVPVQDLFSSVYAWIDLQRLMIPFVMIVIAIVATFNVVSTLLITVIEKTPSIATLSTLGAGPRSITRIFVTKGVLITAVGLFLGAGLTLIFSILQQEYGLIRLEAAIYVFEAVPIAINPLHYLVVIGGTLLLALVTTILPAAIASRTQPMTILRFR